LRLSVVSYLVGRRRHVLKWCTSRKAQAFDPDHV
jgi:hypothetical protein